MRASPLFTLVLTGLSLLGQEESPKTFRQWLGGQEVGGARMESTREGDVREARTQVWMVLSRQGQEIRQDLTQTTRRTATGNLVFTWRLQVSSEPFEGRAEWSPGEPGVLSLHPSHGPAVRKEVPPEALLWPEDLESRLKEAARLGRPIQVTTFSFPLQQWNTLNLQPHGAAPLPGFPDAVRFTGEEREGGVALPVEIWISPTAGEVRNRSELVGLELLTQRSELPAPGPAKAATQGFFERTLLKLPPHPFLLWIPDLTLRAEGTLPELPEDAQQIRLAHGRWRLRRATPPSPAEATQPPVTGVPLPEEARYLAPSPLVPYQDPAFDGLLHRLALPKGLSRWDLARRVNTFVFDWITDKDFTVGFASALEVCHHPRGDCTEHGVLAVALLRRLGVPARGVTGWLGLGEMLGLHFWVEVRLGERWIPIDPTFDQAPASALRIKVGDTDLADLGSVGWEGEATDLSRVRWIPEREGTHPWNGALTLHGDQLSGPGGLHLRLPGGHWDLQRGVLHLRTARGGPWRIQATPRPAEAQLKGARHLAGPRSLRTGWWNADLRVLWMDLGDGRWLQAEAVSETDAFDLLDQLMAPTSSS
jgi:transglutaminase-like putative cysteine protease